MVNYQSDDPAAPKGPFDSLKGLRELVDSGTSLVEDLRMLLVDLRAGGVSVTIKDGSIVIRPAGQTGT